MPAGQPFTDLCQQIVSTTRAARADLHTHTNWSDGEYTPAQVIELARRCNLAAIAITDHDTIAGIEEAQKAAATAPIEVVPGVEITAEYAGRELHILGYFFDASHPALNTALGELRERRRERFITMIAHLHARGVELPSSLVPTDDCRRTLGRRHLAAMLIRSRRVGSIREAFARYLHDGHLAHLPKLRLNAAKAIALVRDAGGVAAWAHPSYDELAAGLPELVQWGLGAVEVEYPGRRLSQREAIRTLARRWRLLVTGGSDCHGPDHWRRSIGSASISLTELAELRQRKFQ